MAPDLLPPRMAAKIRIAPDTGCWLWTGCLNSKGYGCWSQNGKVKLTHRVAYELLVGPIPEGMVNDHLCRERRCCFPGHLEPVTSRVNTRRGMAATATECKRGHAFDEANTYITKRGTRECRICRRMQRERFAAKRVEQLQLSFRIAA